MHDLSSIYPKLPDAVTFLKKDDGNYVIINPDLPAHYIVNENFINLLALCDGSKSLLDIQNLLAEAEQRQEALDNLLKLHEHGFFASPSWRKDGILPLTEVHLNMSSSCNLRCLYCYAEERPRTAAENLSLSHYEKLLDELAAINPGMSIVFTGGEPLLSPLTLKVAEYAKKKDLHTMLLTNGLLIDEAGADLIGRNIDFLRISLDGATADSHDRLRGKGSHAALEEKLALLEDRNVAVNFAMTVTRLNRDQVRPMAEKYGAKLIFQPLYKLGRAKDRNLGLTPLEYYKALTSLKSVRANLPALRNLADLDYSRSGKCAIAESEISISPQGEVYPCHMLHDLKFLAGNIKDASFTDIYYNSEILNKIRSLSVNDKEDCKDCPFKYICNGGCWARCLHSGGSLLCCDPFCEYEILTIRDAYLE